MKMKKLVSVFLVLGLASHAIAFAEGEKGGNGGTVVDCGGKVRLADFVEPTVLEGLAQLKIPDTAEDEMLQIERAIQKIGKYGDKQLADDLRATIADIRIRATGITGNYYWSLTSDVGSFSLPSECQESSLKNAIIYLSKSRIRRNEGLYQQLSTTHRAGIWFHEGVFKLMRDRAHENSAIPARRITAFAFSTYNNETLGKALVEKYLAQKTQQTSKDGNYDVNIEGMNVPAVYSIPPQCAFKEYVRDVSGFGYHSGNGIISELSSKQSPISFIIKDPTKVLKIVTTISSFSGPINALECAPTLEIQGQQFKAAAINVGAHHVVYSVRLNNKVISNSLSDILSDYLAGFLPGYFDTQRE